MKHSTEKPLIKVCGEALVERVNSALANSHKFDRMVAVVSRNTPQTREFLEAKGIDVVETAGDGYSQDLAAFLAEQSPARVFVFPSDLPLLTAEVVSEIAGISQEAPAVSVILDRKFVEDIGIRPGILCTIGGKDYCHSGITLFEAAVVVGRPVQEKHVVMNRIEIAVNVNTQAELDLAEKLLVQRAYNLAKNSGL
jgi:adenosylcobinamide-phosphate guanylyltransferase